MLKALKLEDTTTLRSKTSTRSHSSLTGAEMRFYPALPTCLKRRNCGNLKTSEEGGRST